MNHNITVSLEVDGEESYRNLAVIPFTETTPGKYPVFGVGPVDVEIQRGSAITVTARWSPGNQLMSIVVQRDGKTIGHAGTSWERGDPYLGLRLEGAGFLHLNCARKHA